MPKNEQSGRMLKGWRRWAPRRRSL